MRYISVLAIFLGVTVLGGQDFRWDFKDVSRDGKSTVLKSLGGKGRIAAGEYRSSGGINGGGVLVCGSGKVHRASFGKPGFEQTAIDIVFKPDAPITKKMTLFGYQENTWGRAYLGIYITSKSRIGVLFQMKLPGEQKKFELLSEPVEISSDRFHTVRVTLESGKMGRIYLDGKLLAEEQGAFSFSDFKSKPVDQYHPFAQLGSSYINCGVNEPFDGLIAGVSISGSVNEGGPSANQAEESRTAVNILARQIDRAPVIDGKLDDACYQIVEWTIPFMVMGAMSQEVNGLWVSAAPKFLNAASRASIFYDNDTLYAAIRAPFPPGMTPKVEMKTGDNIWNDDCVEFFLHPGGEYYYQFLVNAKGAWQGFKHADKGGLPQPWRSEQVKVGGMLTDGEFRIEIAVPFAAIAEDMPVEGTCWMGNFAREGATCGGLSSWAPVGTSFLAPDRFGRFIFGSRQRYFESQLDKLSDQAKVVPDKERKIKEGLGGLRRLMETDGELPGAWLRIHNQIDMLGNQIMQAVNAGKKQLVMGGGTWSNFGPNRKVPFGVQELGKITLEAPRGARAITSFMVANITDRPSMNNLMFKADAGSENLNSLVRFREVGYIELNGGTMIPDPIFEMPLGSMLRIAPGNTGIVWVDVDCGKLAAGHYSGTITLYPSYSGFEKKTIKLSLDVSAVDISNVYVRNWTYAVRDPWTIRGLAEYGFNCIIPIPSHYYPKYDHEGKAVFPALDKQIQAMRDTGIPLNELFIIFYPEFSLWSNMKLPDGRWGGFMEPDWRKELGKRLILLRNYLKGKYNISYDQYAFYPTDEPNGDPDNPKDKAYFAFTGGRFIKSVDSRFQLFANPYKLADGRQQRYFELFEILEPFYPQLTEELKNEYRKSGREIWTYSIFEKSVVPSRYRHLFWENLEAGFKGPATFYDLFATSGDAFNSYDSENGGQVVADYAAAYRNTRLEKVTPSRRLEAWYLGYIDFKLARFCEKRIAEMQKSGHDTAAYQKELDGLILKGYQLGGNMDEGRSGLLRLAEKLILK